MHLLDAIALRRYRISIDFLEAAVSSKDDIWAANAIYEDCTDNICYFIDVYVMSYVLYNISLQIYGC